MLRILSAVIDGFSISLRQENSPSTILCVKDISTGKTIIETGEWNDMMFKVQELTTKRVRA